MKKVIPFLLVLLSMALGAAFGWYRAGMPDLHRFFRRTPGTTVTPVPPPRVPPPPVEPEESPPEVEEAAPPAPETPLALADSLFQDLEFDRARTVYARVARSGDPQAAREARRKEILCDIFERATRGVPRTLGAQAPHEVTLANERVLVGHVTTDADGNVTLMTDQGITATFRPEEVISIERVETATWRASREAELERRLKAAEESPSPALEYYQAAYFSIRNGLADRAADLLLRSAESEGFTMLIETFGAEDADRLLTAWDESTRPAPPPPVVTTTPTGAVEEMLRGDEFYQQGLIHYRRSWPGMKNAAEELEKAKKLFQEAQTAYEKAVETRPDDHLLKDRIQSIQTLIYDCIKRARL